jgi:hypothetical protein
MNATARPAPGSPRSWFSNPALVLTIALPLFAVCASLGAVMLAYSNGDPALPEAYHWEGALLDRDFAATAKAAQIQVQATLHVVPQSRLCRVSLALRGPMPRALELNLTHGASSSLDQHVVLALRDGAYEGACIVPGASDWQLQLSDPANQWLVRSRYLGVLSEVPLNAAPGLQAR